MMERSRLPLARRSAIALALGIVFAALVSGCAAAKPMRNDRRGLLDRMSEQGTGSSRRTHDPAVEQDKKEVFASGPELTEVRLKRLKKALVGWRWPVDRVVVTSGFGARTAGFHDGIDLKASVGTPIHAAQAGVVLYAGRKISGYGNLVVLKHGDDLATIYAHNSRLLVHKGQRVKRGQLIAYSGRSGRVRGPHLHFEIRSGLVSIDPMRLLPENAVKNRSVASK